MLAWRPVVRQFPCSTQDMLLHSQKVLKKRRMLSTLEAESDGKSITQTPQ
jgi:hypothetical protein